MRVVEVAVQEKGPPLPPLPPLPSPLAVGTVATWQQRRCTHHAAAFVAVVALTAAFVALRVRSCVRSQ